MDNWCEQAGMLMQGDLMSLHFWKSSRALRPSPILIDHFLTLGPPLIFSDPKLLVLILDPGAGFFACADSCFSTLPDSV